MIRKLPGQQKFGLYSTSTPGKRLGVFRLRSAAVDRERQINFFKHRK